MYLDLASPTEAQKADNCELIHPQRRSYIERITLPRYLPIFIYSHDTPLNSPTAVRQLVSQQRFSDFPPPTFHLPPDHRIRAQYNTSINLGQATSTPIRLAVQQRALEQLRQTICGPGWTSSSCVRTSSWRAATCIDRLVYRTNPSAI